MMMRGWRVLYRLQYECGAGIVKTEPAECPQAGQAAWAEPSGSGGVGAGTTAGSGQAHAVDHLPRILAGGKFPHPADSPDAVELAVRNVLQEADPDQPQQVARIVVPVVRHLLDDHRPDGDQRP